MIIVFFKFWLFLIIFIVSCYGSVRGPCGSLLWLPVKCFVSNTRQSFGSIAAIDAACCYRPSSVVCLSVYPSVGHVPEPCKTAEPIEMLLGAHTCTRVCVYTATIVKRLQNYTTCTRIRQLCRNWVLNIKNWLKQSIVQREVFAI